MAAKNTIENPVKVTYDPSKITEGFKPNKSLEIFPVESFSMIGGGVQQAVIGSKSKLLAATAAVVDFELIEDMRQLRAGKSAPFFSAIRFYPAELRTNSKGEQYKLSARACFFVPENIKETIELHQGDGLVVETDDISVGNCMMYFTLNNALSLFVGTMDIGTDGKKSVKNFIPWIVEGDFKTRIQKSMVYLSRAFLNMVNPEEEVHNI